jgi:hypothetical protein
LLLIGFADGASASTWSWDVIPPDPGNQFVTTLNGQDTIPASFGFGSYVGAFSHSWGFNSVPPDGLNMYVNELLSEKVLISRIAVDNLPMHWEDTVNQRWFGITSLAEAHHTLTLAGSITAIGQRYLITGIDKDILVANTPIPAAIWLFGSALAGLMAFQPVKKG